MPEMTITKMKILVALPYALAMASPSGKKTVKNDI